MSTAPGTRFGTFTRYYLGNKLGNNERKEMDIRDGPKLYWRQLAK